MNKDERLAALINTVENDISAYDSTIISNETYCEANGEFIQLDKSARSILVDAMRNHDHILRELCKLTRPETKP